MNAIRGASDFERRAEEDSLPLERGKSGGIAKLRDGKLNFFEQSFAVLGNDCQACTVMSTRRRLEW